VAKEVENKSLEAREITVLVQLEKYDVFQKKITFQQTIYFRLVD